MGHQSITHTHSHILFVYIALIIFIKKINEFSKNEPFKTGIIDSYSRQMPADHQELHTHTDTRTLWAIQRLLLTIHLNCMRDLHDTRYMQRPHTEHRAALSSFYNIHKCICAIINQHRHTVTLCESHIHAGHPDPILHPFNIQIGSLLTVNYDRKHVIFTNYH